MKEVFELLLPAVTAVVAWVVNEHRKRAHEDYIRKEKNYESMFEALRGFYTEAAQSPDGGRTLKERFLLEVNKMWLYCPDEVIKSAYAFLETVGTGRIHSDADKERAVGAFVLAARMDLLSRKPTRGSHLRPEDFKHLRSS